MEAACDGVEGQQVAVRFGGLVALADLNFVVGEGEIVSPDWPEWRGQDDGIQCHDRLSRSVRRERELSRHHA